jgi:hypothetical protein
VWVEISIRDKGVLKRGEKAFSEESNDILDGYLRFSVTGVSRSHIHRFLSPLGKLYSFNNNNNNNNNNNKGDYTVKSASAN